ncbi:MAG: GNAT family protein [Anaerolineales bacterium]
MDTNTAAGDSLRGQKVRLAAVNAETDSETMAAWSRDPELLRNLDTHPARHWTARTMKETTLRLQGEGEQVSEIAFGIRRLEDGRLIGMTSLEVNSWPNRDAWVAIAIGERENWSKGYGSDALRLLLRYAFAEMNLDSVSLVVFGYNERAQRSYLKVGFKEEGRQRERLQRGGERHDMVFMSVLRADWQRAEAGARNTT